MYRCIGGSRDQPYLLFNLTNSGSGRFPAPTGASKIVPASTISKEMIAPDSSFQSCEMNIENLQFV